MLSNYINTIFNMDCLEGMKGMPDNSVDLVIADPPYNLSKGAKWKWDNSVVLKGMGGDWNKVMVEWDDMSFEDYWNFTVRWVSEVKRILKPTGSVWIFGTYHNMGIINVICQMLGVEIINEIIWFKFNNSFHHTRKGIEPKRFEKIVYEWHERIVNVQFICGDYRTTTQTATKNDIIYLEPPYENTKGRYYGTIDYEEFYKYLDGLNKRGIRYVLSFDGIRGDKEYETGIPKELYVKKYLLASGNSSFKKVMDKRNEQVYEALYLNW